MFARALVGAWIGVVVAAAGMAPAVAQVRGDIAIGGGPIGVRLVFGPQPGAFIEHQGTYRYAEPAPARYRRGMSLQELDVRLHQIEHEYEYYRRLKGRDAYHQLGWTDGQLKAYVRFLKDERHFLRAERKRLGRLYRAGERYDEVRHDRDFRDEERGRRGRGRGRGR